MRRLELMVGLLHPSMKAERQEMLLLQLMMIIANLYYYYYHDYHYQIGLRKLQVAIIYETLGIREAKGTHLELEVVS
jgi:hypothetical protein